MSEPTIRIHLGSHKTATTYVQEMLHLNRARSAAAGIAYWQVLSVRKPLRNAINRRRKRSEAKGFGILSRLARRTSDDLAEIAAWFDTDMSVTLSEENILGNTDGSYRGEIYPHAAAGLAVLRRALPARPLELWLSIRSYAPYFSSMYAESLRHGSFRPLDRYLKANRDSQGQWPRLVDRIREIFPEARLVVWRYEDFASLEPEILAQLSGVPYDRLHRLQQTDVLPSASREAIERMIAAAPSLSRKERVFRMLALQDRYPRLDGSQRFAPWSAEDEAALDTQYRDDVERLKARDDVAFLG